MRYGKLNNMNIAKQLKSFFLAGIYFFILSLTTFHHHPNNLDTHSTLFSNPAEKTSSFHFTSEECPIINFANNGFNSFGVSHFNLIRVEKSNPNKFIGPNRFHNFGFSHTTYLRGPPSS